MATKSENAEIAVLQDQMETMKIDVREMKIDLKSALTILATMPSHFVTVDFLKQYIEKADAVHDKLNQAIETKTETANNRIDVLESDRDKQAGAVAFLKIAIWALSAIAAMIGGLWWIKG